MEAGVGRCGGEQSQARALQNQVPAGIFGLCSHYFLLPIPLAALDLIPVLQPHQVVASSGPLHRPLLLAGKLFALCLHTGLFFILIPQLQQTTHSKSRAL